MNKDFNERLRKRLKYLRERFRLTQSEVARLSNGVFNKNHLSNWERGATVMPAYVIPIICKIYRITPNQLFGWEEETSKGDMAIEDIKRINNFTKGIASKYEESHYDNLLIAASGAENFDEEDLKLLDKDIEMVKNLGKNNK